MKKHIVSLLLFGVSACAYNPNGPFEVDVADDNRWAFAEGLIQDGRLAEALVQMRVLAVAYPDSPRVTSRMTELQSSIDKRIALLSDQLSEYSPTRDSEASRRQLQLKILALKPDHAEALSGLRESENQQELKKVKRKAKSINAVFARNNEKVKRDTALTTLLIEAEKYQSAQDFQGLLKITAEIEKLASSHRKIQGYRFEAWRGIAETELMSGKVSAALTFYDNALKFATSDQQARLIEKIRKIRERESSRLYAQAMRIFKVDIEQSIQLLEQAASIDPANNLAKQQLLRARKIYKNLRLIQSQSP